MASISFDQIPSNLRTPGFFVEFNNELAGAISENFMNVIFGQRLITGTKAAGTLSRVNNPNQAKQFFGRGSMLAASLEAHFKANPSVELWVIPLDENPAGQIATGTILVAGPATAAGTINLLVHGELVQVGVADGATSETIATAIAAAITANADLNITAQVDDGNTSQVNIACKWRGETGNTIPVLLNYGDNEFTPEGLTITITPLSGGTANPSIAPAIAALGDEWFNWFGMSFTDTPNLAMLRAELDRRFDAKVQKGGRALAAYRGTHAQAATFGNSRGSEHISFMGTNTSPQPPYIWMAANLAVASKSLSIDPARPLQTLTLPGILPAKREDIWDRSERNQLLFDGISTHTVSRSGEVQIERQITAYQYNDAGLPDASYLDINTPETLERIRFRQRSRAAQLYPRHKLADDSMQSIPGQAIVRPKDIRAMLLDIYREMMELGWVEDFEGYKATLIVVRNPDNPNRVDINDQPRLVNQLRIYAHKAQFVL